MPMASTSRLSLDALPPLPALLTWVHRPQAIAKCFISDIYRMAALVPEEQQHRTFTARDVFLLDNFPCKIVELVAWVAGVDDRGERLVLTEVDDGDGMHVLPVTVRLKLLETKSKIAVKSPPKARPTHFLSSYERELAKQRQRQQPVIPILPPEPTYERKDIRVGDTVRIVGRVEEWRRKGGDWVREVVVDPSSGSVVVVDPEEQFRHTAVVSQLHQSLYSRPFEIPLSNVKSSQSQSQASSPVKCRTTQVTNSMSLSTTKSSMEPSSEAISEYDRADDDEAELRDPSLLRSSQLTIRTFRLYLLDFMTRETTKALLHLAQSGPTAIDQALGSVFPEFASSSQDRSPLTPPTKARPFTDSGIFFPSSKDNLPSCPSPSSSSKPSLALQPFTLPALLLVPHLHRLGTLIVSLEVRKDEKRRRKRIREGAPRVRDLAVEAERRAGGYKLGPEATEHKIRQLVQWTIREVAQEGGVVESKGEGGDGYLPVSPPLLFPLVRKLIRGEEELRRKMFMPKGDRRRGNGVTVLELAEAMKRWGKDGRWERIGEWSVEEAVEFGLERGLLSRIGTGYGVC
ncbi:hypothetical protein P7C73_g4211, partial [Tremellales sp. Uapishka_1]